MDFGSVVTDFMQEKFRFVSDRAQATLLIRTQGVLELYHLYTSSKKIRQNHNAFKTHVFSSVYLLAHHTPFVITVQKVWTANTLTERLHLSVICNAIMKAEGY